MLGVISEKEQKWDEALFYYNTMLEANIKYNNDSTNLKLISYYNLAFINGKKGNYAKALNLLNEADKISKEYQIVDNLTSVNKLKIEINKKLSPNDTLSNDFEVKVKEDSLKKIQNDNKALVSLINHQKKDIENIEKEVNTKFIILTFVLICILFIAAYFLYKNVYKRSNFSQNLISNLSKTYNEIIDDNKKYFKISKETEDLIIHKLDKFEKKLKFLEPNISLASLSIEFNSNTAYLSEVINLHKKLVNHWIRIYRYNGLNGLLPNYLRIVQNQSSSFLGLNFIKRLMVKSMY